MGPEFEKGDGRLRPSLQQRLPGAEGPPEGCTTAPRHAACGGPLPSSAEGPCVIETGGTEQVQLSRSSSGVAGGHAKWFRALPAEAPPRRRSVTECRPMTPGAGPSAETEGEANARAPQARHCSATAC